MHRLYFVAPNVKTAQRVVHNLLLARVEERHIHVLAKEGVPLQDLPEASLAQKSDLTPAIERGLAYGGAAGMLAGVAAITLPPAGLVLGGGAILLATTLAGAGVGAWAGILRGLSIPNTDLARFEEALEEGRILLMVDVPKNRVETIQALMHKKHPEVRDEGREPTQPHFP